MGLSDVAQKAKCKLVLQRQSCSVSQRSCTSNAYAGNPNVDVMKHAFAVLPIDAIDLSFVMGNISTLRTESSKPVAHLKLIGSSLLVMIGP